MVLRLPQSLEGSTCEELAVSWQIHPHLAARLLYMDAVFRQLVGTGLRIISGWRSMVDQERLEREGRPAARDDLSTHRSCPATGADLDVPVATVDVETKLTFGHAARAAGLRWGGGSPVNSYGIPSDWNHVDLGPRSSS